jgi:hypothetical protein
VNKNIVQSNMRNAGSNLNWPRNYINSNGTSYDVYSVKPTPKQHLWCTDLSESVGEKLAVAICFLASIVVLCFSVLVVF